MLDETAIAIQVEGTDEENGFISVEEDCEIFEEEVE